MLLLHVSDTHLGAIPSGLTSRAIDIYDTFKETIDIALREHIDIYIHTGDFFNTATPPPEAYIVSYRGLKKLKDRGIKIIAIAGQHDLPKRYAMSPLSILRDVEVIDYIAISEILTIELQNKGKNMQFICVPHSLRHKISSIPKSINNNTIIMAHLLIKELGIPSNEADISLDIFPLNPKYIALGDYHIKTVLVHRNGAPVVYPGSTEVHRVNEYGEKYVALVDLSGDEAKATFVRLENVRPWIITACSDASICLNTITSNAKNIIQNNKKRPLVYITLENIKTEILSKYLDELITEKIIEHYTLVNKDHVEYIGKEYQGSSEQLEYIDVRAVIRDLIGDEKLENYLLEIIENPSKNTADELVDYLKNNIDKLKELENKLKSRLENTNQNMAKEQLSQFRSLKI